MHEGIYFTVLLTQKNRGQGNLMVSSCLIVLGFTGHENLSLYGTVKFYVIFIRCWGKMHTVYALILPEVCDTYAQRVGVRCF